MMLYLLHGWGFNAEVFTPLIQDLAFAQALDLPGHGGASYTEGQWQLSALADDLARRYPQPAAWLGWSLGGMVALSLALRHPQCVQRLILVATPPRFTTAPDWPSGVPADTLAAFGASLISDLSGTLKRFLALQAGVGDRALVRQLTQALKTRGSADPRALAAGLSVLRTADLRNEVAKIGCPTLIIQGEQDKLVSGEAANYLAEHIPDATLQMLGRGHAPFLSEPQAFLAAVREFIA